MNRSSVRSFAWYNNKKINIDVLESDYCLQLSNRFMRACKGRAHMDKLTLKPSSLCTVLLHFLSYISCIYPTFIHISILWVDHSHIYLYDGTIKLNSHEENLTRHNYLLRLSQILLYCNNNSPVSRNILTYYLFKREWL